MNKELMESLLRSNMACFLNKPLTEELAGQLIKQIIESIGYFLNKDEENTQENFVDPDFN